MSNFITRCLCGHTLSDHHRVIEKIYKCDKCVCEKFTFSAMLNHEENRDDTEKRLQEVLRNKYQEFCPNCEKQLGLIDAQYDVTKYSFNCQIRCQNCYELLVEISSRYRQITAKAIDNNSKHNINYLIEVLNDFPHLNQVK